MWEVRYFYRCLVTCDIADSDRHWCLATFNRLLWYTLLLATVNVWSSDAPILKSCLATDNQERLWYYQLMSSNSQLWSTVKGKSERSAQCARYARLSLRLISNQQSTNIRCKEGKSSPLSPSRWSSCFLAHTHTQRWIRSSAMGRREASSAERSL